jgi:hypothetical protein
MNFATSNELESDDSTKLEKWNLSCVDYSYFDNKSQAFNIKSQAF